MKALNPETLRAPFAAYSHGTEIPCGMRLIRTSGQLGIEADDSIPDSPFDQAVICFGNIRAILAEGGMTPEDVVHVTGYVTAREHMAGYMRARDAFIGDASRLPSSTLLIVSGFTKPEFKVEVEVWAAQAVAE
ncbi:RidA family protein [Lutimaribacter marinistellae]|uniref:RidA family protein n=1 Tax=Lutimaribacter marinistellae TaxID=1820329 RepID=A0ABV7TFW7_9RHOB